jgi:hypothetical protein
MVGAAGAIRNRHTVIVRNSSPQRLDNVRVFGAGCEASFGSIPPGATEKRSFRFLLAGDLSFQASIGNDVMETAIRGYVHDHTHGYDTVTVEPDQDVSVLAGGIANASLLDRIREAVFWPDRALCRP